MSTSYSSGATSTQTSKKVITETKNGKTYTKTIITETTTGPDGKKTTSTHETVTELGSPDNGASGGGSFSSDFDRRFNDLSLGDARNSKWETRNTSSATSSATSSVTKEKEKKPQKMKDFIEEVVKYHNKYRKKHGKVGDIKKSKDLCVLAQRWADHLAAAGSLKHSEDTYKGERVGENVASRWSSAGADYTGEEVVEQWYSESAKFDFSHNDFTPGTGHFSQVVWKDSKEIGVGKTLKDGHVYVVCNYFPAGNYVGKFKGNVFPA